MCKYSHYLFNEEKNIEGTHNSCMYDMLYVQKTVYLLIL